MDHAPSTLLAALERGEPASFFGGLSPADHSEAARLALQLGRPRLAALWASLEPLTHAAALLRLGESHRTLLVLQPLPDTARPAALRARARWQLADPQAQAAIQHGLTLARQEGDVGAVIAAATLRGEQLLTQPHAALRALAEGLKVAEATGRPSDAHLLAVLAHAQLRLGGAKGLRTAEKALERSLPRSPARVLALQALKRWPEAAREAADGGLAAVWWRDFSPDQPRATPG
jgi:nucleotide-binding universal stress UspA family protein